MNNSMEEKKQLLKAPHSVVMEERHNLTVTGVEDVDSFDEQTILAFTTQGELTIRGTGLHINSIDLRAGELQVEGDVQLLQYQPNAPTRGGGLLSRLFR